MATYNGEQYLPAQLESVLSQLEPGDEIVVVDDGSTDGTCDMLAGFSRVDGRVRLHLNPVNLGVTATFERALSLARNELVFLCDQDDIWLPRRRAAFVAAFERDPACGLVICDARVIDGAGQELHPSYMRLRGGFHAGFLRTLLSSRYLGCAMAMRIRLVRAGLPIPAGVPMHDMWFGALASLLSRVTYLPEPHLLYRRHGRNASPASRRGVWQMLRWRVALLRLVLMRVRRLRGRRGAEPESGGTA
jgi:glycosyltransferase involved in cell wall biosynthesis